MTADDDILLDINSILASVWPQCHHLLVSSYPLPETESVGDMIEPEDTAQRLVQIDCDSDQSLTTKLNAQLDSSEVLSAESFAILKFIDQLFDNYLANNKLHSSIKTLLLPFRKHCALSLLHRRWPWLDEHNPMQHLDLLAVNVAGWQPELGRAAERFLEGLKPLVIALASSADETQMKHCRVQLETFFEKEQQRIKKLEQRLRDAEVGALHAKHAQQLSARTLNQQMAGKKLPASISAFLQGPWRESMRLIILSKGKASQDWRRILRLTETLIWSFQPIDADDDEKRQHVYQSISEISEEFHEVAVGLHHTGRLDEQLAVIEKEHLNILRGKSLEYAPFQLIENTDPLVNAQVSVSSGLIKQVSNLSEGQWFVLQSEESAIRIKLAVKIDQAQQLLLTNFLGIKVKQYSYEEFAYMLSSKIVRPIPPRDALRVTGEKMLATLIERNQEQKERAISERAIEEEILRQQAIAREEARKKALKEAEAVKAAKLATKKQEEQQQAAEQQQLLKQQKEKDIERLMAALKPGGKVAFRSQEDYEQHRLAAILQTTGEYVFVNREGIKKHVVSKEQLIEMLLNDSAKILDQGTDFDSTLEQVVNSLRARKKL